jgi:hypothetical protein
MAKYEPGQWLQSVSIHYIGLVMVMEVKQRGAYYYHVITPLPLDGTPPMEFWLEEKYLLPKE